MMNIGVLTGGNSRFKARGKNQNLKQVTLPKTPENKKLVEEYKQLAADINAIPSRISGLYMNFRKSQIPSRVTALLTERDEKMQRLLDIEKILFSSQR